MASLDLSAELQLSAMSPLALALHACGHGTYVITRLSPTEVCLHQAGSTSPS
eukprot:NODE_26282_length_556_cov_6.946387.p6 GENE.NODE_26282_length_556_cov_6.946387~~NODE_26282_length_556_cov_6.946387.p6  ORF type:complete len:52 (-),score=7.87 NODE_26282_length_556_cov_6.946387:327-482(-)